MNLHMSVLSDENLQVLVKTDLGFFLDPIKRLHKQYTQYHALLGNMRKDSLLVKKNLPNIATKLYRKQDMNYVKAMESVAEKMGHVLLILIGETLDKDVSYDEICAFSDEQMADVLRKFHNRDGNVLENDLFIVQLKMIGFPDADERIGNILKLSGMGADEVEVAIEEDEIEEVETAEKDCLSVTENRGAKIVLVGRKAKKLSPEEKAAKTRAAESAKEKLEEKSKEENVDSINGEDTKEVVMQEVVETAPTILQTKKITDQNTEEIKMKRYIGVVNIKSNFYNFTPVGTYEDEFFIPYSEQDVDMLLPDSIKHNINFTYNFWDDKQNEFMKDVFKEGYPVLLNCEIDELEANITPDGSRNVTGYKIQAMEAWNKGKISPLSKGGLYDVLTKENLLDDFVLKPSVRVEKEGLIVGQQVLVNLGDGFYAGPFTVKYAPTQRTLFITMQPVGEKYFIRGYNAADCKRVVIEPSYDVQNWIGYKTWSYWTVKKNATQVIKDFIPDKELLESFKETLGKSKDIDFANLDVASIIEKSGPSQIINGATVPEEVRKQRISKIHSILSAEEDLVQLYAESADLICNLLLKNKNSDQVNMLFSELLNKRPDLLDKMPGVKAVQTKIDKVREELEELEHQKSKAAEEILAMQEKAVLPQSKVVDPVEEVTAEILEKKAELDTILEKIKVYEMVDELQKEIKRLKEEVAYYESHKSHLVNDLKDLRGKFEGFLNDYSDKMASITFDGFISSKMLQAAAEWEAKEQNEKLSTMVSAMNNVETHAMEGTELVDYLVNTVQIARPGYSRNAILNIFICTVQGFLTVFSGMPGCGKTSICNIVSKVLGLDNYSGLSPSLDKTQRFISVSVERGWTSKRDFIGYFNPLTKTYEESNREVFDGLKFLDMEKKKGYNKWPFVILLDEANLSPMEYYWADFMNVCDDLNDKSSINLGNENVFRIPKTLHFLATINNDHTTETLSPRLIDRAWVITLPKSVSLQAGSDIPKEMIRNITWEELENTFIATENDKKNFDRDIQVIYDGLKEKLSLCDLYISPRVDIAIQNYWFVASRLMDEDEYGNSSGLVALDYAVAQKILPKIKGSSEDYEAALEELQKYCNNNGLSISAELLTSILNRGNRQMKYYEFFN